MAEVNYIPDPRAPGSFPSRAYDCCEDCVGPDAPSNVSAAAAGALVLDVTWTDNATDETGYDVRWRNLTTGGDFVNAPSEPADATTATVDASGGSSDGDSIEVQVRAAGSDCNSDWVAAAPVTITDTN